MFWQAAIGRKSADRKRAEIFDLLRQWEAKSSEAKTGGNVGDGN
jgi:hypothetical protein